MTDAVAHRGPDGIGVWTSGPVGLGSCLLKSIPEAAYEQLPLVSEQGRYVVALDGRIDNRRELANAIGLDASTLSVVPDSEILLAAYRKWGKRCLERVVGDFAFAIWDSGEQEVFCGRDPIGVRLLHYYCDGKRFIAATEVAQILAIVKTEVDPTSLASFLETHNVPQERTFLKGIKRLPGGCQMTVSASTGNSPKIDVYWNPDPTDLLKLTDDREYEEQFLELFKDSIRDRIRGFGPAAVSLSGGMDSTSILATAEHMRLEEPELAEIRFYSNVYSDLADVDESEYIRQTVGKYGTQGTMIESGDFEDKSMGSSPLGLKRAEPYVAPHEESHRKLFAEVQQDGIRTLLTGVGGDEVFFVGHAFLADRIRSLDLRTVRREWRYFSRRQWLSAGMDAIQSYVPMPWRKDEMERTPWVRSEISDIIEDDDDGNLPADRKYRSYHFQEVENWLQKRGGLPGYTWTDVTTAEYGIEARHPFLDRRIVEFLAAVPPHVKFRFGYNKRVLRRAMKNILPETVRSRRYKTNFSSLFDVKAVKSEAAAVSELFESPVLAEMGMVDPAVLKAAWSEYQVDANNVDNERRTDLWAVMVLEQWLRQNIVDDGIENEIGVLPSQRRLNSFGAKVAKGGTP